MLGGAAALTLTAVVPAGAQTPAPYDGPATLLTNCQGNADASVTAAGTVIGFANCGKVIKFFRYRDGQLLATSSSLRGSVLASAWDGAGATYVVYQDGSSLKVAKRVESTASFSGSTTIATGSESFQADIVAKNGKWWVVFSKNGELYQRRTLNGELPTTRITTNTVSDVEPALAYADGKATLLWQSETATTGVVRMGTSNGGAWSTSNFSSTSQRSLGQPRVVVSGGKTYGSWKRDDTGNGSWSTVEKDNATGTWRTQVAGYPSHQQHLAVSMGKVFIGYNSGDSPQMGYFQRTTPSSAWSEGAIAGPGSYPGVMLAWNGKGIGIYWTFTNGGALKVRQQ